MWGNEREREGRTHQIYIKVERGREDTPNIKVERGRGEGGERKGGHTKYQ